MPPKKDRKTRVVWTDEEITVLTNKAVELYLKGNKFVWAYISDAQMVLPEDRRRRIIGQNGISPAVLKKFLDHRQDVLEEGVPVPITIEKEIHIEQPAEEVIKKTKSSELMRHLLERFSYLIDGAVSSIAEKKEVPLPAPIDTATQDNEQICDPKDRKPRVLMFGFLPRQEHDLRDRAKAFNLDLRFQRKEGRQDRPPTTCNWCVTLRKIRHSMGDKLKDHFGDRMFIVEGTDGALKVLADIHSRVCAGSR